MSLNLVLQKVSRPLCTYVPERCAALVVLLGAACSPMVGEERPRLSQSVTQPELEAPLPVADGSPPTQSSENPAISREPPAVRDPRDPTGPRTGAPGSTKGTISCGTARCDASTHECDWDVDNRQWSCVRQQKGGQAGPYLANCDDASDCAASEACCLNTFQPASTHLCMPRAHEFCRMEVCQEGGAPCPRGTTCDRSRSVDLLNDENGIEGVCRAPASRATCANKERCPQEKPVCVMARKSNEPPTCEAETSELVLSFRAPAFGCTRQGDCKAGESCMFGARSQSAFCGKWKRDSFNALVCDPGGTVPRLPTETELKSVCAADADCRKRLRCWPRVELPWLGALDVTPREPSDLH